MRHFLLVLLFAATAQAQTYRVYGIGGRSLSNWHGQADVKSIAFEVERPITAATEFGFVVAPYAISQPVTWFGEGRESINAISGSLLVRHTFRLNSHRAQPYVELASGPMWAERRVPAATSRFNFVSQGGAGFVLLPDRPVAVTVGYRFLHISNGGYAPRNPGLNINSFVLGLRLRR